MATTQQYLEELITQKNNLVSNLVSKGVDASNDETFTTLVPKINDIPSGGGDTDWSIIGYEKIPQSILDGYDYAIEIQNNWDSSQISYKYKFSGDLKLTFMPVVDVSNATDFSNMFYNCENLKSLAELNTTKGITMESMFYNCTSLVDVLMLDTSNVTNMKSMFSACYSLVKIPQFDTSNVTNMGGMFANCYSLVNLSMLNTSNVTGMYNMFTNCVSLVTIPQFDTSNVTDMSGMFGAQGKSGEYAITEIPELDANKVNNVSGMFGSNYQRPNFTTFGGLKDLGKAYTEQVSNTSSYHFDLSRNCSALTHDSLMNVINKLYDLNLTYDVANGGTLYTQKLTLGSTNLAKLTAEEIAIATNKGWTVA